MPFLYETVHDHEILKMNWLVVKGKMVDLVTLSFTFPILKKIPIFS